MQSDILRIGTRGSALALAQAEETARLLAGTGVPREAIEIVAIKTSGDRIQDRPLSTAGGKGLFTKEIEEALIEGRIDVAVHSAKDMPTFLPEGLEITGYLKREDPRDVFISPRVKTLAELPAGAKVATSSLRRKSMVLRLRPDIVVVDIRGNVETRLRKLAEGLADATLLALAGLRRLGAEKEASSILDTADFVPAVGQGAIALEARIGDQRMAERLGRIIHADTGTALAAERAFLAALDGSCRTPIGGHAEIVAGEIRFHGIIITPDGRIAHETRRAGAPGAAAQLGREAGEELARLGGPDFFA